MICEKANAVMGKIAASVQLHLFFNGNKKYNNDVLVLNVLLLFFVIVQ